MMMMILNWSDLTHWLDVIVGTDVSGWVPIEPTQVADSRRWRHPRIENTQESVFFTFRHNL